MLTSEQKASYNKNGFLKLEGLFDPRELEELCKEYEDLFQVHFQNAKIEILTLFPSKIAQKC